MADSEIPKPNISRIKNKLHRREEYVKLLRAKRKVQHFKFFLGVHVA